MDTSYKEADDFLNHKETLIAPIVYKNVSSISLQFLGWELVLLSNGHYYLNDTSGG